MRKLLFAIFILFTSCVAKDSPFSPSLAKVLDGIIGKTHNFDVIQVIASKLEEHDLLIITCVPGYNPKVMDGYYIYKDKLITYYQTDSTDRSDIIDTKYLYKYEGNIPNYIDVYEKLIFCEPIPNYKYGTIDEWNYPYPLKFEILPNGNLRKLSFSEGFAI